MTTRCSSAQVGVQTRARRGLGALLTATLVVTLLPAAAAQGEETIEARRDLVEIGALIDEAADATTREEARAAVAEALALASEVDATMQALLDALEEEDRRFAAANEGRSSRFLGIQTFAVDAVREYVRDGVAQLEVADGHLRDGTAGAEDALATARAAFVGEEDSALASARRISLRDAVCVGPVSAKADDGRAIRLSWGPVAEAGAYTVWRTSADGVLRHVATLPSGSAGATFVDPDVEPGATYRYAVEVEGGRFGPPDCPTIEVTAVPFFPGAWAAALGGVVALLALVGLRRNV
jgi:hypothetical protein